MQGLSQFDRVPGTTRRRTPWRGLAAGAGLAALGLAAAPAAAQVTTIGPGLIGGTTTADTGDRTNISTTASVTTATPAGTYDVTSFFYDRGGTTVGEVQPFLARLTGTNQYQVVWSGSTVPTAGPTNAVITGAPEGRFTLNAPTTLYAGFTTTNGGRVMLVNGVGTDDHNGVPIPVTTGQNLTSWTNPNLGRTYRDAIAIQPAAGTSIPIGPGITSRAGTDNDDRLNIDQIYSRKFTAGTYTINSFKYYSSSIAGVVVPLLAVPLSNNNWQFIWVGDQTTPGKVGDVEFNPNATITLATDTQVYAGFYTLNGGRVGFDQNNNAFAYGLTDHTANFNTLFPPQTGDVPGTFSNPDLARRYDFSIGILNPNPFVPEPATAGLLAVAAAGSLGRRRRRR